MTIGYNLKPSKKVSQHRERPAISSFVLVCIIDRRFFAFRQPEWRSERRVGGSGARKSQWNLYFRSNSSGHARSETASSCLRWQAEINFRARYNDDGGGERKIWSEDLDPLTPISRGFVTQTIRAHANRFSLFREWANNRYRRLMHEFYEKFLLLSCRLSLSKEKMNTLAQISQLTGELGQL